MAEIKVGSTTTPYNTTNVANNVSSTTQSASTSSATVKAKEEVSVAISSNTPDKMNPVVTSSTTTSYGASSTQSNVRIISSTTANVTSSSTPSTTPNVTSSSTLGATPNVTSSSTPSATANVISSSTPSTTPNVTSSSTPSTTPNLNASETPGISSETLQNLANTYSEEEFKQYFDEFNRRLNPTTSERVNDIFNGIIEENISIPIYDVKLDLGMYEYNQYANANIKNADGIFAMDMMNALDKAKEGLLSFPDTLKSLGEANMGIGYDNGKFYLQGTIGKDTIKLNLESLARGELNLSYEHDEEIFSRKYHDFESHGTVTAGINMKIKIDPEFGASIINEFQLGIEEYKEIERQKQYEEERQLETDLKAEKRKRAINVIKKIAVGAVVAACVGFAEAGSAGVATGAIATGLARLVD